MFVRHLNLGRHAFWVVLLGAALFGPGWHLALRSAWARASWQVPVPLPPAPCTFGRKHAGALKSGSATGCSAKIRTRTRTLCGEPTANTEAASAAWVGVTKFVSGAPEKWAQIGYTRERSPGTTTVHRRRYAETKYGTGPLDVDIHLENNVPSGTHEYKCYLVSSLLGVWRYEYDGLPFHVFGHSGWRGVTGTHYQWDSEIFNKEDQLVGTSSAKCNFTECKYALNWGAFQNADIATGDLHTDDPIQWGIERVSATAINVWDKIP